MKSNEHTKAEENTHQNRGYFSEKATKFGRLVDEYPESTQNVAPAVMYPMHAWRIQTEQYSPVLQNLHTVRREHYLEPAQKWIRYPGKISIAFPVQTIKPKVQLVHDIIPGQLPREVEVDRRRRKYAKMNIQDLLGEAGIDNYRLTPVHVLDTVAPMLEKNLSIFHRCCLFPLEWFDNQDFDPMTPHEWLQLGYVDGLRHPIPAEAFLPNRFIQDSPRRKNIFMAFQSNEPQDVSSMSVMQQENAKIKNHLYTWTKVAVKNYDPAADKWIVTDLATTKNYKIPRIYLMFTAENPQEFVKRIRYAVDLRDKCERTLKFEVIVDCLQLTGLPKLQPAMLKRMYKLAKNTIRDPNKEWLDDLELQVNLMHQRVHAAMDFKDNVLKNPEEFFFVQIPENTCTMYRPSVESVGKEKFSELLLLLKQNTIFYVQQSISAMYKVASECETIEKQSLFMLSTGKTTTLKDFVSTQQYTCNTVSKYLKGFWLENMTGQICMRLRGVGKGWLDLTIRDWGVYKVSKIYRFLRQVKFRMQDALHRFLERSILGYCKFLGDPCETIMEGVEEPFEWIYPFNVSPFKPKTSHIFFLTLMMSEKGAYYSTDPDDFRPAIIDVLDEALLQCCGIHQVDPNVMSSLVFQNDLYLQSVVLVEDLIEEFREKLIIMYDRATVPLKAYADKFEEFLPLYLMNVADYVKDFFGTEKTPYEVKEEVLSQVRLRDQHENDLPKTIVIGPFLINVDPLKQLLVNKRKEIIKKHLETYTEKLRKKTETLIGQLEQIMMKVSEKAMSIEHMLAIREFAETVPDTLVELSESLRQILVEYDILDFFWHNLSNDDFALKWEAIGWPHKIIRCLDDLHDIQELETEEFRKQQINDQISFSDRLESINEEIMKYSRYCDPNKATENATELKKTWKVMQELEKLGETLQQRQVLFGLSSMSLDVMQGIMRNLERYKSFWFACADFLKYEEIAYGNNLVNVDVVELRSTITGIIDSLIEAKENFREHPEVLEVCDYYLDLIEKFQPSLEILEYVRAPHFTIIHWQELIKRAELDMKYSSSINFRYCINKGILDHVELIKEIWEASKHEAELEAQEAAEEELRKQEEAEAMIEKKKNRKGRTDI
ncbi:unnamed protein product [Hermetia illucens]|uniref:Dynein heavy chain linker domain-containing protein n=1 Tax=Hermetia illucens TaxID=343691 RepID=A0A7R8USL8_HERIL|nr:dynein heavy chain 1, axonemal [Hermetia illucens]CAD7086286.1 unnamed protein product [Hermetia illucens]